MIDLLLRKINNLLISKEMEVSLIMVTSFA